MSHLTAEKTRLLARIRRLKGQIDAVERAVDSEKPCGEILQLVASIRGATAGLTAELVAEHLQYHVLAPDSSEERAVGGEQLLAVLRTYMK